MSVVRMVPPRFAGNTRHPAHTWRESTRLAGSRKSRTRRDHSHPAISFRRSAWDDSMATRAGLLHLTRRWCLTPGSRRPQPILPRHRSAFRDRRPPRSVSCRVIFA